MAEYDHAHWQQMWRQARRNMPRISPNRMGSPTVLRMLLGYKATPSTNMDGKTVPVGVGQHCRTAEDRGDRPRREEIQRLLVILAGTHGTTMVRAIAIRRGLDLSKYKYWPDGKGGFNVSILTGGEHGNT